VSSSIVANDIGRFIVMKRLTFMLCTVLGAAIGAAQASAAVETNERFSFSAGAFTCSGEIIDVEVDVHLLSRVTRDAHGVAHLGSTVTTFFRGESASGGRYIGPSHQTTQLRGDVGAESTHTETFNQNLILLGENGTADDLRGRAIFHFTFNANGELVASKFDFSSECA
jgi:hypothetical protein